MPQIKQPSPARIMAGKITAKRAAELASLRLPQVVSLCRGKRIFGVCEGGIWWVSPVVLDELRALSLLGPRQPGLPEVFAKGGVR